MATIRTLLDRLIMDEFVKSFKDEEKECRYCHNPLHNTELVLTVDHKQPLSRGGKTTYDNLFLSCDKCNCEKKDLTLEEYYEYRSLNEEEKLKYLDQIKIKIMNEKYKEFSYKKIFYKAPVDTEELIPLNKIKFHSKYKKEKLDYKVINSIKDYYDKFRVIKETVVLLPDNILLYGFEVFIACKQMGVNVVPVKYKNCDKYYINGIKVPKDTDELIPQSEIISYPINQKDLDKYNGNRMYYDTFGTIEKPILIDERNCILEGFSNYFILKEKEQSLIPVRRLNYSSLTN